MRSKGLIISLLAALCGSLLAAAGLPHELVWLRIKSDPRLNTFFDWTEFNAPKGQTMRRALHQQIRPRPHSVALGHELHLYKVVELDLDRTIEELGISSPGEFYLTDQDLMGR